MQQEAKHWHCSYKRKKILIELFEISFLLVAYLLLKLRTFSIGIAGLLLHNLSNPFALRNFNLGKTSMLHQMFRRNPKLKISEKIFRWFKLSAIQD